MTLINESILCLEDAKIYLEALTDIEYQQKIEILSGSSIGQHTRHFIEFYLCLIHQFDEGEINYDQRTRNHLIETNRSYTLDIIEQLCLSLQGLDLEKNITLTAEINFPIQVKSNVAREILYNLEHCIHHLAIIKIGLKVVKPSLILADSFGVAASTVRHKKTCTSSFA